jgi:hypothetical protein
MQDWTLHSNTTGGYFQCNRFDATAKVEGEEEGTHEEGAPRGAG